MDIEGKKKGRKKEREQKEPKLRTSSELLGILNNNFHTLEGEGAMT